MASTLMQRCRTLASSGCTHEEIAVQLMVSAEWVRMLMSADSFRLVKGDGDEDTLSEGEDGRDTCAGQAG
jgi:orotate phosphoribosyltransferase-like protein